MFVSWIALVIVVVTIAGVAVGRLPVLRMNRATIAFVGAVGLILVGAIPLERAYASLDLDTLALLFSMMVINANLRLAGFFGLVAERLLRYPLPAPLLLLVLMLASGLLSALFLNDTIVLMMTPLVVQVLAARGLPPLPFLVGLATAANIGSVGAITGNPQNILIGSSSGLSFIAFSAYLMPVAVGGLVLAWAILAVLYRKTLRSTAGRPLTDSPPTERQRVHRPLLRKGLAAVAGLLVLLLLGVPVAPASMAAAALLLVTRRLRPERVFRELDGSLLVLFAGLFVVTEALTTTGWSDRLFRVLLPVAEGGVAALSGTALVLSNLISNVPAVLLFRPFVPAFANPEQVWLTLAMATTLAGNLTLVGSVANLIVAELAARHNVRLSFAEHLKAGVPVTLATLALGILWLSLVF